MGNSLRVSPPVFPSPTQVAQEHPVPPLWHPSHHSKSGSHLPFTPNLPHCPARQVLSLRILMLSKDMALAHTCAHMHARTYTLTHSLASQKAIILSLAEHQLCKGICPPQCLAHNENSIDGLRIDRWLDGWMDGRMDE